MNYKLPVRYVDRRDRYGLTVLTKSRAIRIFYNESDNPLLRLLSKGALDDLVAQGIFQPLKIKRFTRFHITTFSQKRLSPLLMPSEWTVSMLADSALLILRAESYLNKIDMTVDDPHPWNILFDDKRPFLVDMGAVNVTGTDVHWSSSSKDSLWQAYPIFKGLFINALFILSSSSKGYARRCLVDYTPISNRETLSLLVWNPGLCFIFGLNYILSRLLQDLNRLNALTLRHLSSYHRYGVIFRRILKDLYLKLEVTSVNYISKRIYKTIDGGLESQDRTVTALLSQWSELMKQGNRRSVCIYSHYSQLYESLLGPHSEHLLFLVPNEDHGDFLYRQKRTQATIAYFNYRSPSPGVGPLNQWNGPAIDRLRADRGFFVLDLNELVIKQCMTVDEVFRTAGKLINERGVLCVSLKAGADYKSRNYGQLAPEIIVSAISHAFEIIQKLEPEPDVLIFQVAKIDK